MIDKELVIDRLSRIRDYVKNLRELGSISKESFIADYKNCKSAERILQIAIEACLDIGHHIISRKELRRPKDYKDIFLILGDEKILPYEFSRSLVNMAKYRNRLVHIYLEVTPEEIHDILRNHLNDIEEFTRYIVNFLEQQ